MTAGLPYATPAALRTAVKARFTEIAKQDPRFSVAELQRQFAYDRVLSRCFCAEDADRWILKGGGALLARLPVARHSNDIDLLYAERDFAPDSAVTALARNIDQDIGDHFRFEITRTTFLQESAKGRRVHLRAYLGVLYATFHVDVVVDTALTAAPDIVAPLTPLNIEGLTRPSYRAFPLPDHCADKLCAIMETHHQSGRTRESTRVKDLVDLSLIASTQQVDGPALRTAILAGTALRNLPMPTSFAAPDAPSWKAGFTRTMAATHAGQITFAEGIDLVSRFLNPVLAGPITGTWNPERSRWRNTSK
jgi:hypothetical protein